VRFKEENVLRGAIAQIHIDLGSTVIQSCILFDFHEIISDRLIHKHSTTTTNHVI